MRLKVGGKKSNFQFQPLNKKCKKIKIKVKKWVVKICEWEGVTGANPNLSVFSVFGQEPC